MSLLCRALTVRLYNASDCFIRLLPTLPRGLGPLLPASLVVPQGQDSLLPPRTGRRRHEYVGFHPAPVHWLAMEHYPSFAGINHRARTVEEWNQALILR